LPYTYKTTAEVVKAHKNGWVSLKMDKNKQTQTYRIHLRFPKRGVFSNHKKEGVYIMLFPTEKVIENINHFIYKQLEIN
jgi:hypothetical protein